MEKALHLDFETYSGLDLKKVGVENYVRHPDFAVTVVGWAFGDGTVQSVVWPNRSLPDWVYDHITGGGTIKAWNARFEWHVLTYHYGLNVPHGQMDCVMERALAYGLPGALQDAGEALKLGIVKDKTARDLMLKMGKPRKIDGMGIHTDQTLSSVAALQDLAIYCRRDVEAERALDKVIPALSNFEKDISVLSARSNEIGVLVDLDAVRALEAAARYERTVLMVECRNLTNGAVVSPGTETAKMLKWLAANGCPMKDLTKGTVAATINNQLTDSVRRVLELRQLAAKSSLAKLEALANWASSHDGRARNMFQYYGAGRTGRWAGRGPQPQNLPRPEKGLDPEAVIGTAKKTVPGALGLFHGAPLKAISGSLRGCLIARPKMTLVSIDLSQIEARVLAWLAGQQDVLDVFRRGEDVYTYAAAGIGSRDRQLGKVMTLGLGYGMGTDRFIETAASYGVTLGVSDAETIIAAWRQQNSRIVWLWWAAAAAARRAIGADDGIGTSRIGDTSLGGGVHAVGPHLRMKKVGDTLAIRKPNSVKLIYHQPDVDEDDNFRFWGVDPKSTAWMRLRTYGGKFVENVVQSVARDIVAEAFRRSSVLPIMTVHDEIVWEIAELGAPATAVALQAEMEIIPEWAKGLPVASEVKISRRYGK